MMLKSYIFKPTELPQKYRSQIIDVIKDVVDSKTDSYWKNYTDREFNLDEQTAISVSCDKDEVKVISSIYHREFFGKDVYRLWNRFLYSKNFRETGGSKKRKGIHINHSMLNQQIDFVEKLNPKFYFISRQRTNTRWLKYYFDNFNKDYNKNLVISDRQYWVCDGNKEGCVQTIIYPKHLTIRLKSYK
ncbi:MAG: hypothetical protein ACKVI2_04235, partial [Candidatus Pelagibacterales bacterium]